MLVGLSTPGIRSPISRFRRGIRAFRDGDHILANDTRFQMFRELIATSMARSKNSRAIAELRGDDRMIFQRCDGHHITFDFDATAHKFRKALVRAVLANERMDNPSTEGDSDV
jgi:hypothetical protein